MMINLDTLLWLIALLTFVLAAYGTWRGRPALVALGWLGAACIALAVLT